MTDTLTVAQEIEQFQGDVALTSNIVKGPAAGDGSTVDVNGDGTVIVPTFAKLTADASGAFIAQLAYWQTQIDDANDQFGDLITAAGAAIGLWDGPILGFLTAAALAALVPGIGDRYVLLDGAKVNQVAEYGGAGPGWLYSGPPLKGQIIQLANDTPYCFNGISWLSAARFNVVVFGCKLDGVTDDTAAFQAALTACGALGGGTVEIPYTPAGMHCLGTLNVPAGVKIIGIGGRPTLSFPQNNINTRVAFLVNGAHVEFRNLFITCLAGTAIKIAADNVTDFEMTKLEFTDQNPAASCISFYCNQAGIQNHRHRDIVINGGGYGIQYDSQAAGGGVICQNIVGNAIGSDCLSFNTTAGLMSGVLVLGGDIDQTNAARTGTTSGFAVAFACTKNARVMGLRVRGTRNEAIHIEQGSENIIISGCDINVTSGVSGIKIYGNAATPTKGVTVANTKLSGNATGIRGIEIADDGNATTGHLFIGNTIRDFNSSCIKLAYEVPMVCMNKLAGCPLGIQLGSSLWATRSIDNNEFISITTAAYSLTQGIVGLTKLSGTLPAAVCTGMTGMVQVHGVSISSAGTHNGAGAQTFALLAAPKLYVGTVGWMASIGSSKYTGAARFDIFDGATLTTISSNPGAPVFVNESKSVTLTGGSATFSAGNVVMAASYAGAASQIALLAEYGGVWIQF